MRKIQVEWFMERVRTAIQSTRLPKWTLDQPLKVIVAGQRVVPPAGFEPALPPPEAGRSRDPRRLLAFYLGFLCASCASGDLFCAVVLFHETFHDCP